MNNHLNDLSSDNSKNNGYLIRESSNEESKNGKLTTDKNDEMIDLLAIWHLKISECIISI